IREALTVEDQQVLQHAIDGAICDARRIDPFALDAPRVVRTAFEKRVRVGIEQSAEAGCELQCPVAAAVVDQSKQRQELRPRAVASLADWNPRTGSHSASSTCPASAVETSF